MYPVLFTLFGFPIHAFGVMVAIAFSTGLFWILNAAQKTQQATQPYLDGMCWAIFSAIIGARVFYWFFFPDIFWENPLNAIVNPGGLVWYGGMIGVIAAIILFTRFQKQSFWAFADTVSPAAALGLAIGRIGCLLAGCCYGGPCPYPWAIRYPLTHETLGIAVHPAPLYESVLAFLLFMVLQRLYFKPHHNGQIAASFLLGYGLIRFGLEMLRGDRLIWFHGPAGLELSASQLISLTGIVSGLALLGYHLLQQKNTLTRKGESAHHVLSK